MKLLHWVAGVVSVAWLSQGLLAQESRDQYGPKPAHESVARAQYKANLEACKGNPDKLVLPGLVADRTNRTVEVLAESTGLKGGDIVEFLLVDHTSDRGYEALLWSYAKPSDVHRALAFIGLEPGAPFNPDALRFWSDGDRVILTVRAAGGKQFPIERLVADTEGDTSLPEAGFVFGGSIMVPPRDGKGEPLYGADVDDSRSVASIYNDPVTVLDVPRQVNRNDVYGKQVVNSEYVIAGGELLTVVMTPGDTNKQSRTKRLELSIDSAGVSNGLACRLSEAGGKILLEENAITPILERLVALGKANEKASIELSFGNALPLEHVRKVCVLMAMMEGMGLVRIAPPAAGQLYYRAFVPDKKWLTPAERPAPAWELHLSSRKDGRISGQLVWHEEVAPEGSSSPTYKRDAFDVAESNAVRARVDAFAAEVQATGKGQPPGVMLVFAAPGLSYGETMKFVASALTTHVTVYVFVETK